MLKKTIATVIALTIAVGGLFTTQVQAAPGPSKQIIPVVVNGQKVKFPDTEPYINTDYFTMVPLRFVSEQLGATVSWSNKAKSATLKYEDKTVIMTVGSKKVKVNGEVVMLDTVAEMYDGRTMVPLRFVSEVLGSTVKWDKGANSVIVTDKAYAEKVANGTVTLDPWGREYSTTKNSQWNILKDLEKTTFYSSYALVPESKKFMDDFSKSPNMKKYIDEWSTHIKNYYEVLLNVDYNTISEKKVYDTMVENMRQMSEYDKAELKKYVKEYVKWVKNNKVITVGYADPEQSQSFGRLSSMSYMRVHFKFKVLSATDTSKTFMDNWDIEVGSTTFKMQKNVWYDGYSTVDLDTNYMSQKESGYGVRKTENMFRNLESTYKTVK